MSSQATTYVLLGISGSGKGTQAAFLRKAISPLVYITMGNELRRLMRKKNFLGRYVTAVLERGGLLPYWAASHIWLAEFFERLEGDEHILFDGSPRRVTEARMLDDFMRDTGRKMPVAIYFKLSPQRARLRLMRRRRFDDRPRAIAARFRFFEASVRPVIRYYRTRRRLVTINGDQAIALVWRDIRKQLRIR